MFKTYLLTVLAIPILMMLWLAVQTGWRKLFREFLEDEDVLAGRKGCSDCSCLGACQSKTKHKNSSIYGGHENGKYAGL